jgi:Fe-S cluster biogenesis protein NfuA
MVVDGLPTGVTATISNTAKTITFDGSPSVTTTYTTVYNYTVSSVGPSGCPEAVLYGSITVEPEEVIELVSAASTTNQTVCAGDILTDNIVYDIKGSALTISPTLEATIGLPTGLTITPLKTQQVNRVNITGAVTGTYILGVNGSVVSYTYATGNTTQTIRDALRSAINGDVLISNVVLAADIGTDALSLTAKIAGTPFSVQIGGTVGGANMSNSITATNTNRITIGGTVNVNAIPGVYSYTVSTTAGGVCASPASLSGTITIPSATVTLKNGIQTMLKEMMPGRVETVAAVNG